MMTKAMPRRRYASLRRGGVNARRRKTSPARSSSVLGRFLDLKRLSF
jgi:hypothetical protein